MIVAAVAQRLPRLTHVVCFSDSVSTACAITTGNSAAQLNVIIRQLQSWVPGTQLLGVHQPGIRNGVSDSLSRGKLGEVLSSLRMVGLHSERLPLV